MPIETTHSIDCDVVVGGGGMAGVCAAIAAARHGARVVLIGDRPVLGGNASSEIRMTIGGASFSGRRADARETGILEELRLVDAVRNPTHCAQMWDLVLWEYATREPHITLLLNTSVDGAIMRDTQHIEAITATRPSTEDRFVIHGRTFIDCTGDGRLGAEAGADYRVGRESHAEFGERSAPAEADDRVLGSSILFQARDAGRPIPFTPPPYARHFTEEDLEHRGHVPFSYGFWWMEYGGELDTIKDEDAIRAELYAIAMGVWDHIKNGGDHGAENWALEWIGMLPGKRESRRFLGPHILTQEDVEHAVAFEDAVAYGGWPIDTHPPAGIYSRTEPCHQPMLSEMYHIPLRSLYSRNIHNMLMAGRNVSATHLAFASLRVMATCAVMGQAAGVAAAHCVATGRLPHVLTRADIHTIQQTLLKDDCYIIGVHNEDTADLARSAAVTASSEAAGCPASHVINGVTRRTPAGSNMWASDPALPLPQWIELRFPQTVQLEQIRITFDTELTRLLAITYYEEIVHDIIRAPQPETIKDYDLFVLRQGQWESAGTIRDNYQRLRIHNLDPGPADAIRIVAHATNGIPEARIFEIRCY
jgi:hypothetical protein